MNSKTTHPKTSLHSDAAFCLRQKLRRDSPKIISFQHYISRP